jgi:hypothetical protein
MLYRRTPRNPPTLLLRIVASAGAGTLIGMASCGGETSTANGSIGLPATEALDAQGDDSGSIAVGSITTGSMPCMGICGVVVVGSLPYTDDGEAPDSGVSYPDASVADVEVHGVVPLPEDAGYDAHRPIGVIVEPPDGSRITCPPLCGVVIGLGPNPGH